MLQEWFWGLFVKNHLSRMTIKENIKKLFFIKSIGWKSHL